MSALIVESDVEELHPPDLREPPLRDPARPGHRARRAPPPSAHRTETLSSSAASKRQSADSTRAPPSPPSATPSARCSSPKPRRRSKTTAASTASSATASRSRKSPTRAATSAASASCLFDFENPDEKRLGRMQPARVTVVEDKHNRRPDVVVFVNGLPLAIIELKNPGDETATIQDAFHQLQTYKKQIPSLFVSSNELLIVSDDVHARIGARRHAHGLVGALRSVAHHRRRARRSPHLRLAQSWTRCSKASSTSRGFLDLVRGFIVFEEDKRGKVVKKLAGYHQFHAVRTCVWGRPSAATAKEGGDRRKVGVVFGTRRAVASR